MRQLAPGLRPGAYLLGVAPPAAGLSFSELEDLVNQIMKQLDRA